MSSEKIPVIFDCDPGVDDAVALMVAFAQEKLDILAVTTVAGNVPLEYTTRNARAILATMGVKSKIYKGASEPLMPVYEEVATTVHGATGLGNYSLPEDELHPLEPESALVAMHRILSEAEKPVTIIAVGPLTNIAILIKAYPELKKKIEKLSIMGGAFKKGNKSPAAEYNVLFDPEAAEIVFNSGIPIILASLDITLKAAMSGRDLLNLREVGNPISLMLADTLEYYFGGIPSMDVADSSDTLHDVVSVLALTDPELFTGMDLKVVVETGGNYCRGYTLGDFRAENKAVNRPAPKPNTYSLFDLDVEKFHKKILEAARSYK
jgi:pyrimidine-specific ribonucleoside hydrolase